MHSSMRFRARAIKTLAVVAGLFIAAAARNASVGPASVDIQPADLLVNPPKENWPSYNGDYTGRRYSTEVEVDVKGRPDVRIGHTLANRVQIRTITLDGKTVHEYLVRTTNRGTEVTVPTGPGHHVLTILTRG